MASTASSWLKAPFEGMSSSLKVSAPEKSVSITERVTAQVRAAKDLAPLKPAAPEIQVEPRFTVAKLREAIKALEARVNQVFQVPVQVMERTTKIIGSPVMSIAAPALLAGTLALTPVLSGSVPEVSTRATVMAVQKERIEPLPLSSRQSQLLAETRGKVSTGPREGTPGAPPENLASIISAILAKLDSIADRPIDLQVTTRLDGREIARSVYKDIRERKVKNYETL